MKDNVTARCSWSCPAIHRVFFDAVLPAGEPRMLVDTSVVIYMPLEPVFALRRGRWMLYAD